VKGKSLKKYDGGASVNSIGTRREDIRMRRSRITCGQSLGRGYDAGGASARSEVKKGCLSRGGEGRNGVRDLANSATWQVEKASSIDVFLPK